MKGQLVLKRKGSHSGDPLNETYFLSVKNLLRMIVDKAMTPKAKNRPTSAFTI